MAAHVVNPRQLLNGIRSDPRLNALSERARQGSATFVEDPGTAPHGGSWTAQHELLGPSYMRAAKMASLPSYDEVSFSSKEEMREEKRQAIHYAPDTVADLEASGIRDPIKVGHLDPFDYLRQMGHPGANDPMQVMNGNHRVTWALDNHPSMWVPMQVITREDVAAFSDPYDAQRAVNRHGKGPSFQ
jgi:hypothetical protein